MKLTCRACVVTISLLCLGAWANAQQQDAAVIQEMIDSAATGDVVSVPAGVFQGTIALKEGVTLVGEGPDRTIIDGTGKDRVVTAAKDSAIIGCAIRNGKNGIWSKGKFAGVFECRITGSSIHGIAILGGSALIANNIIEDTSGICGIVSLNANPMIRDNLLRNNSIGVMVYPKHVPTVTTNLFVDNKIGIKVAREAELISEGNVFDGSGTAIEGHKLSDSDEERDIDVETEFKFPGASVDTYRTLMNDTAEVLAMDHPLVIYYLPENEVSRFNLVMLFPWPDFMVGASAKDTVIEGYDAFDLAGKAELSAKYMKTGGRPAVSVKSTGVQEKDMDRYVLESSYYHPESYYMDNEGKLHFNRLTSLSRIHIIPPKGYLPVKCNHPVRTESIDGQLVLKIVDVGNTSIDLVMERKQN